MKYREILPPPDLRDYVECVWHGETANATESHPVRPDGCCDVTFSSHGGLVAVGSMPVQQVFSMPAGSVSWGIRFHPGMAPAFFGAPASELTGAVVEFAAVCGHRARRLASAIESAASPAAALFDFAREFRTDLSPVQKSIHALRRARGNLSLALAADQAGLSVRQFRRRCEEASGLAPRHLARILRFRHACEIAARQNRQNWAAIALDAGYFDQAHLIRDFREFTGATPVSLFSNHRAMGSGYHRE